MYARDETRRWASKQGVLFEEGLQPVAKTLPASGKSRLNRCAEARAYYGACILAAASIEVALLATCDLLPAEARDAASRLNLKLRGSIAHLGLAELLKIATTAGWLAADKQAISEPDILVVTDLVRRLRNLAHPGKHLREVRRVPLPRSAFRVAWYAIDAVREQLAGKLGFKLPPNAGRIAFESKSEGYGSNRRIRHADRKN